MMRWSSWPVLALAMIVAALLASPAPVGAHALLTRSDPPQGAQLRTPPGRVSAWFSEPVEPGISTLRVLDGDGQRVDLGETTYDRADPATMAVELPPDFEPGFYTVTWETLSRIDGHIRFGSFGFTVLNPDGSPPTGPRLRAAPEEETAPTGVVAAGLTKFLGLLGAVLLVGSLAFVLLVARPALGSLPEQERARSRQAVDRSFRWASLPALVVLVLVGAAELLLQARQLGGVGELGLVLTTTWGERWLWRQLLLIALLIALVVALIRERQLSRVSPGLLWSALVLGFGYLLVVSAVSHAAALVAGSFWATLSDAVHLIAAAVWLGGLVQLGLLLVSSRRLVPEAVRPVLLGSALQRFSLLAATSIVLLLTSGLVNALVHVGSLAALGTTAYGRVLLAKLVLLLPLLAVAGLNAIMLRPRLVQQAATGQTSDRLRERLARLVTIEAALGVVVLGLTGVLVQYPTARPAPSGSGGSALAYPLTAGNWLTLGSIVVFAAGALLWVWATQRPGMRREPRKRLRAAALATPVLGLVLLLGSFELGAAPSASDSTARRPAAPAPSAATTAAGTASPSAAEGFTPALALRYQRPSGQFVLLEVAPFAVGENIFRVTMLNGAGRPVAAESVTLRLSRLEHEGAERVILTTPEQGGTRFIAEAPLPETGWWAVAVAIDGTHAADFYLRLDDPSGAPLAFAAPDYRSDPAAEALFKQTVARYEALTSVRWREELTSGLLAPIGIGAWVVSDGAARAPDKLHLQVLSPGVSQYQLYRVGDKSCTQEQGGPWRCHRIEGEPAFDLEYQEPATAFRLGRREMVDGELSRVLLFYNPSQPAWYAWWVGEETGYLRRQAMVAAGHFMLTRYVDHNAPIEISLPPQAQ